MKNLSCQTRHIRCQTHMSRVSAIWRDFTSPKLPRGYVMLKDEVDEQQQRTTDKSPRAGGRGAFAPKPQRELGQASVPEARAKHASVHKAKRVAKIRVPEACERCSYERSRIMVRDHDTKTTEFICMDCKLADKRLHSMPVTPKP